MTKHNNGGPAFPCEVGPASDGHTIQTGNMQWMQPGMTLRDYFAAKAMQSVLDGSWPDLHLKPKQYLSPIENSAVFAYEIADAMLKARETA